MGLLDSYQRQDPKRQLAIGEKLQAIRRVTELGETKASVSRMYGVPESTLRGWCKNKDKLKLMCVELTRSSRNPPVNDGRYEGLLMPVSPPPLSPDAKKVKMDMNGFHDSNSGLAPPVAHSNAFPARLSPTGSYDLPRLLALYYAQAGNQPIGVSPDEPLALVKKSSDSSDSQDESDEEESLAGDETALEAISHGERFLRWLESVSDPSITHLQLFQFRCLLDNVKAASFSRDIKCEPLHDASH